MTVLAQTPAADYAPLQKAYEALAVKDYDRAIPAFEQAIAAVPDRPEVHQDLAYTLIKVGQPEAARDHFAEAMRLKPADDHVALEYAFLCYETKQPVEARRTFDRLRQSAQSAEDKATAAQAFENIDRPLREGIARWTEVLVASPDNFSAHEELAILAEQRDDAVLSSAHFEQAWRLRPDRRDLLVHLGRMWKEQGRDEDSFAALLAASRGAEPRIAEDARDLMPARYPYVYEFERALALDPTNAELRREFAYLHLQMGNQAAAEEQFGTVVERSPDDLLSIAQLGFLRMNRGDQTGAVLLDRVLERDQGELADRVRIVLKLPPVLRTRSGDASPNAPRGAKLLAESSLAQGYMTDALKYLELAHEDDPVDFTVMLKLGWTYNIMKNDREAVRWFNLARRSPDPEIATEAGRAYHNLAPGLVRVRTTVWAFPMYSTRWHDAFTYSQIKTEFFPQLWIHPYFSVRFVGDTRDKVNVGVGLGPQYLSERSAILGLGVATKVWKGVSGWFEAGEAFHYRLIPGDSGRIVPDYRGGASYAKGFGKLMGRDSHGWFLETNDDAVFVSRFANDTLFYTQNRTGYTLRSAESAGGFQAQLLWNWNVTGDLDRQAWANFAETGPGVRFRFHGLPASLLFSISAYRGKYLVDQGGVRRDYFDDLRIGIWYALTR